MNNFLLKKNKIFNNNQITDIIEKGFKNFDLENADYYILEDLIEYSNLTDIIILKILIPVLLCLLNSLNTGSLCLNLDNPELINKLNNLTDNINESKKIIFDFIKNIDLFNGIISIDKDEYKPLVLKTYNKKKYLYFQKYFICEIKLKDQLNNFLIHENEIDISNFENIIEDQLNKSNLNEKQKMAIYSSLIKNLVIISGGPGTGKTSIIYWLIKNLLKCGYDSQRLKLACPTGRAAQRLTESIRLKLINEDDEGIKKKLNKLECQTIHRMLNYSINKNEFKYNKENKLPANVIIIDEVSMIDIVLMTKLFDATLNSSKLIFLGDKNQIPSIEAGAVLSELIPSDFKEEFSNKITRYFKDIKPVEKKSKSTDRIIILEKSYRSRGKILNVAEEINKQNIDIIDSIKKIENFSTDHNLLFEENHSFNEFKNILKIWADNYFLKETNGYLNNIDKLKNRTIDNENLPGIKDILENIFMTFEKTKILCITKYGMYGVKIINDFLKKLFIEKINIFNGSFFSGQPIIITQNDYIKQLFNGDFGIILKDSSNYFKAVFRKNNSFILYPVDFLPPNEIAFAITVHKSQGSEYDDILLVIPDNIDNPLLTKEIIYTGLTRAKKFATIYGKEHIFKKAISTNIIRESGLKLWE